jgi:hypothetical protein
MPLFTTESSLIHSTWVMSGREWYRARRYVQFHSREISYALFPGTNFAPNPRIGQVQTGFLPSE